MEITLLCESPLSTVKWSKEKLFFCAMAGADKQNVKNKKENVCLKTAFFVLIFLKKVLKNSILFWLAIGFG
jgi:hypothetical protein